MSFPHNNCFVSNACCISHPVPACERLFGNNRNMFRPKNEHYAGWLAIQTYTQSLYVTLSHKTSLNTTTNTHEIVVAVASSPPACLHGPAPGFNSSIHLCSPESNGATVVPVVLAGNWVTGAAVTRCSTGSVVDGFAPGGHELCTLC